MFMQPLPRLVWQARMYLYAHGSRTWQQSCSHVYTAILLWALGSSLAKTRVFTINPKSGRFSGIYYHNIPLPALFCKGGLGGQRCINVLGLCVLTKPMLRQEALPFRTVTHLLFYLNATHGGCYACRSSPALAHMRDVTPTDLLCHLRTQARIFR